MYTLGIQVTVCDILDIFLTKDDISWRAMVFLNNFKRNSR